MEQKTVIEMKQLNCKIGKQYLLKEINWTITDGEHWILFGLNGSGKTTLLSILAGYQQQTSGELKVFGEAYCAENLIRNRRKIGLVSSSYFDRCYQDESVLEIVLSGVLGTLGLDFDLTDADVKRAKQLLGRLGLAEKINQSYGTMSKGERECVLIARALLAEPEILILDEPCSGLDVLARDNMLHTVEQLAESRETTMIYVTHYMEEILPCFEHAVLLRQGRIYQKGRSQTVFTEAVMCDFLQSAVQVHRDENGRITLSMAERKSFELEAR